MCRPPIAINKDVSPPAPTSLVTRHALVSAAAISAVGVGMKTGIAAGIVPWDALTAPGSSGGSWDNSLPFAGCIFAAACGVEFGVRNALYALHLATRHPCVEQTKHRVILARHSMDACCLWLIAVLGWQLWAGAGFVTPGSALDPGTAVGRLYHYLPGFQGLAAIMLGYQAKNMIDTIIHNDGPEFIVHHFVVLFVAVCALEPGVGFPHLYGIFYFGLSEGSTAILCLLANFDTEGQGVEMLGDHFPLTKLVLGGTFAVGFIAIRCLAWPYLAYFFFSDCLAVLASGEAHSPTVVWAFVGCLGTLTAMQMYWLTLILQEIPKQLAATKAGKAS